ncbi:MAG: hypothetical protein N2506_02370, partial [Dehalococcoidales bacterium]|nr:hypothetical protein [Dehalococcoidales bacterium]
MEYAEVAVNSPVARRRTFSYSIPEGMKVQPGQAVLVPFGDRTLQGIVMEVVPVPAFPETREIIEVLESRPVLLPHQLELARWLSNYYLSPLFEALGLMLPPAFERRAVTFFRAKGGAPSSAPGGDEERRLYGLVLE